jgi:phosphotransferase system enzyme I (PtsI)
METLQGIAVSRGIEIAPVFQFRHVSLDFKTYTVTDRQAELERYEAAIQTSRKRLEKIHDKVVAEIGTDEAAIFHAHLTILQDPDVNDSVHEKILNEGTNAEAALFEITESYCQMLSEIDDEYIEQRITDIRDVRNSVLRVLLNLSEDSSSGPCEPSFIVSQDLTPSDCVSISKKLIKGFCTIEGGTTSHTAILARSLGVPAIVGAPESIVDIPEGAQIIVDGYKGVIVTQPDDETISKYNKIRSIKHQALNQAAEEAHKPAVTKDGFRVSIFANIGSDSEDDSKKAIENGAEGVGLLRTEFIYLGCSEMPDEELQYQKYNTVLQAFGTRPVILRTLDIGGDKQLPYLELPYELNPFLGVRGLRLCLRNIDLFKTQIRAALRSGMNENLRIMFPMVTKVSEIRQARQIIEECKQELVSQGYPIPDNVQIGIMIEIPAAALLADHLAREVDFFSIGTNDLSQYTLAVDRTNTNLADLANAYDPSVLKLINNVVKDAHRYGKEVGVCGELAGDPLAVPILVGLGLDELSMNTPAIPVVKQIVRNLDMSEMKVLADAVLQMETPAEVKEHVTQKLPFLLEIG